MSCVCIEYLGCNGQLNGCRLLVVSVHRSGFHVSESLFAAKFYVHSDRFNGRLMKWIEELEAGQNLTLPELAATLELIAVNGPDGQ
jgi:gamma-glutamyltranspeptidase